MPDRQKKEDRPGSILLHYAVVLIITVPVSVLVRVATDNSWLAAVAGIFMTGLISIFLEILYMRIDQDDQLKVLREEIAELKKEKGLYNSKGQKTDLQA